MSASLVGSEMCIRDSRAPRYSNSSGDASAAAGSLAGVLAGVSRANSQGSVSYTHLTLPTICSV
eukprot:2595239-Alexandrium_andersonii.AAC.1